MKLIDQIWAFFASVQLAILTLCSIAVTSIIGTIIPQGEPYTFYVTKFGTKTATLFQVLDIHKMYSSWWFYGLLGMLSINLIICSLDRIPSVWRIITADNLAISLDRIEKIASLRRWELPQEKSNSIDWQSVLSNTGWSFQTKKCGQTILSFSQKGRWSRMGVYVVHLSILIIFFGAIIGHFFGFKGSVMIPEMRSTEQIFSSPDSKPIDLGFTIRCDSFAIEFYDNGMPKEYRSGLSILENGQEILQKDIRVNSPLSYRGITFYQSSYQAHQEFLLQITETDSGASRQFSLPFQKQESWKERNLQFGIINAEATGQRALRSKLWLKAGDGPAITQWLADSEDFSFTGDGKNYSLKVKQLYSTGLQVAKDPGVWIVYFGCSLLLLGLYMAFFLSHRRIWLYKHKAATSSIIYFAGTANKNKAAFAKTFSKLTNLIDQTICHDLEQHN
ncbi:MAG: cytochrome c biogenesis protein ResB [Desulforhopalus sp.]|nr:cytochrome c biogenesis protein ResB [Desulforhopalus sp.]